MIETISVDSEVAFEETEYRDNNLGYRIIISCSSFSGKTNTFISGSDVERIKSTPYIRLYYLTDAKGHVFVSKIDLLSVFP